MDWLEAADKVFNSEIRAAELTRTSLNYSFVEICEAIDLCKGRIVLTGMGKMGHICRKIAATMQSLGIKAYFMHPGEASHGDMGMLVNGDIIIAVSHSGETTELLTIMPIIQRIGIPIYSIIGRTNSALEKYSSSCIILPDFAEAYLDDIVPSSSTTATLMVGDAIAIAVAEKRGFNKQDFSVFHINGLLGKRLTMRVEDLMLTGEQNPKVKNDATVGEAIIEMCRQGVGGVNVVDDDGLLLGVFADGDLRRLHNKVGAIMDAKLIVEVMTRNPITVGRQQLVSGLIEDMKKFDRKVSFYPVVENDGKLVGCLRLLDISKSGLL